MKLNIPNIICIKDNKSVSQLRIMSTYLGWNWTLSLEPLVHLHMTVLYFFFFLINIQ